MSTASVDNGDQMYPFAARGSQRWLQILIENHPELLLNQLKPELQLPSSTNIEWCSPRASDRFREYRDMAALRKLDISTLPLYSLADFWPQRGPVWDALGKTSDGQYIFVEAKAHIAEAASPATKATPASLALITKSLAEARRYYAPKANADWCGNFYQYANRLAHHYFFRKVNGLRSHLVFLYFINAKDMEGPESKEEWLGAIHLIHAVLGLPKSLKSPGVHEVFIDVSSIKRDV